MKIESLLWFACVVISLISAPLLIGIINKTKAFFAGRRGPRFLQPYSDILKLLKKSFVYSSTSTTLFRLAPPASLAALFGCVLLMPFGTCASPLAFTGDMILFLYLLGFSRIITVLGALDTGCSFEGMGSSREMQFSVISEGVFISIFCVLLMMTGNTTLSGSLNHLGMESLIRDGTSILLVVIAFYLLMLAENCRVPVDDPDTHLELTMIHEAMILDNGGPDLAMIHYGAALKLWLLISFFVMLILPEACPPHTGIPLYFALVLLTAVSIGVTESIMARYRFLKVPQLLTGALCITVMAALLLIVFKGAWR